MSLPDTIEKRELLKRVRDHLDSLEMDSSERAKLGQDANRMTFGQLATEYPDLAPD